MYVPVGDRTVHVAVDSVTYYNGRWTMLHGTVTDVGPLGRHSTGAEVVGDAVNALNDHPCLIDR